MHASFFDVRWSSNNCTAGSFTRFHSELGSVRDTLLELLVCDRDMDGLGILLTDRFSFFRVRDMVEIKRQWWKLGLAPDVEVRHVS